MTQESWGADDSPKKRAITVTMINGMRKPQIACVIATCEVMSWK